MNDKAVLRVYCAASFLLVMVSCILPCHGQSNAKERRLDPITGEWIDPNQLPKAPKTKTAESAATVRPVSITVTKADKWQANSSEHYVADLEQPGRNKLSYTQSGATKKGCFFSITVKNLSAKAYPHTTIKWAILYMTTALKEGESSGDLGLGQSMNCKTEQLDGVNEYEYLVEIFSEGRLIASEQSSKAGRAKIEKLRHAKSTSHHFLSFPD